MVDREALVEAGVRGLIDAETNGLCGSSWPGACDMCDCGLDGTTVAEAAAGQSTAHDRYRVAEVLRRVLPLIADAIEAERPIADRQRAPFDDGYDAAICTAYARVRSFLEPPCE